MQGVLPQSSLRVATSPVSLQHEVHSRPAQSALCFTPPGAISPTSPPHTHTPRPPLLNRLPPRGASLHSPSGRLPTCLPTPICGSSSRGHGLLVFPPRTSQGGLQHSEPPGAPAPASPTPNAGGEAGGGGLPPESPSHPNTKNTLERQRPKTAGKCRPVQFLTER